MHCDGGNRVSNPTSQQQSSQSRAARQLLCRGSQAEGGYCPPPAFGRPKWPPKYTVRSFDPVSNVSAPARSICPRTGCSVPSQGHFRTLWRRHRVSTPLCGPFHSKWARVSKYGETGSSLGLALTTFKPTPKPQTAQTATTSSSRRRPRGAKGIRTYFSG